MAGRCRFSGRTHGGRYSWARYYHPGLGRFISEDPLGLAAGDVNLYAYVGNVPTRYVDRFGLARRDRWDPRTYLPDYARAWDIGNELLKEYPGADDAEDAMRHAEWNRRMVSEIGPFTAESAAIGWE
ncbi:MAG TPA: RHS repeat-associated core domain-containing protein, partial [Dehalococcoidia bacterium]|nr:RHS repeat-associated core domain-containing protein [Dehalococcoidia bacterium]